MLPRILVTCPGSQGTSCPCSPFMIRVEVPGSSFMLCLGPGHSSLLHLTRANAEKPYAGDTITLSGQLGCLLFLCIIGSLLFFSKSLFYTHQLRSKIRAFVSPAYGHIKSALVKCSNDGGPGPRHNMKEDPGASTLIMEGEHGQEVPCDLGQVTAILGMTCPPLLPPPPGHSGQNTLPPPFRGHTPPPAPVPQEASLGESTLSSAAMMEVQGPDTT